MNQSYMPPGQGGQKGSVGLGQQFQGQGGKSFKVNARTNQMTVNLSAKNSQTINIKNQRQTVVDSIAERNKNSLLGITKSGGSTNNNG